MVVDDNFGKTEQCTKKSKLIKRPMQVQELVLDQSSISEFESRELELLLFENFIPGRLSEEDVSQDFIQIRKITSEIRSIHKQQAVLVGERLYKARDILKNYGDGNTTFTKWIDRVFSSRRTAYNILRYFEFYQQLPSIALKQNLKQMPLKVAYCLSSRQAPLDKKMEIIENYSGEKPEDVMLLIKERLPASQTDRRRKDSNKIAIEKITFLLSRLKGRKGHLAKEHIDSLQQVKVFLDDLLS